MADIFAFSSENSVVAGKSKSRFSPGGSVRKTLADVTNIRPRPKLVVAEHKSASVPSFVKEMDRLNKENEALKKEALALKSEVVPNFTKDMDCLNKENEALKKENLTLKMQLVERNKITELSATELQKLRLNLQSLYQQNLQLAQANSQMLAELSSGKDRLRELNHEVGCLKAVLNVKTVVLQDEKKVVDCQQASTKVPTVTQDTPGVSSCPENTNIKRSSTNTRRQSKGLSSAKDTTEEKSENKRRKAPRSAPEELACINSQPKLDDVKPAVNAGTDKEKSVNKRPCLRRQSSRLKSEEPESCDIKLDDIEPTVNAGTDKEKSVNKRPCLRRQSSRLKSEEPESSEDLFELDDIKLPLHAQVDERKTTLSCNRKSIESISTEERRTSLGRPPSRRAAGKVQTYKEIPTNMKMRRST